MVGNQLEEPSYAVRPLTVESPGIAGRSTRRERRWRRWYEFGCESFEHWRSEVRVYAVRRSRGKGSPIVQRWEPVFGQERRS